MSIVLNLLASHPSSLSLFDDIRAGWVDISLSVWIVFSFFGIRVLGYIGRVNNFVLMWLTLLLLVSGYHWTRTPFSAYFLPNFPAFLVRHFLMSYSGPNAKGPSTTLVISTIQWLNSSPTQSKTHHWNTRQKVVIVLSQIHFFTVSFLLSL